MRSGGVKTIRIVVVAACLLLGAAPAASAQSSSASPCAPGGPSNPPPTAQYPPRSECAPPQANRTQAAAGEPITVAGQCPSEGAKVTFTLTPGGANLGEETSGTNGNYSHTFTVPAGTRPGSYQISVTCTSVLGEVFTRTVPLTVVAAAAAGRTLPRTGQSTLPLVAGGVALVALGGVAVVLTRRRRATV
jgi:LPXTG-motif cell wall-anchored protein